MSTFFGCLLAVLLATSSPAIASIVLAPMQHVLERSAEMLDPTPDFGPKLHLTPGDAVAVCLPIEPPDDQQKSLFMEVAVAAAAAGLLLIPWCQRWALFVRMLD